MTHSSPAARLPVLNYMLAGLIPLVGQVTDQLETRQLAVLLALRNREIAPTVASLAALLSVNKSVVSRAVDRLEVLGMVERRVNLKDRRIPLIGLTHEGKQFLASLAERMTKPLPKPTARTTPLPPGRRRQEKAAA